MTPDAVDSIVSLVNSRARRRRRPPGYLAFSRTLTLPSGPLKGQPYNPDSDPCQRYLLEQMDSGKWARIYLLGPPQYGGKTLIGMLAPSLRNAISCRLPVGYGLPTLQDLDKAWAEKLRPAIAGSGYGNHLPKSGPGARGGRGPTLQFFDPETGEEEGMFVFLAGGGYGSTVAVALIDEIDQFRTTDGTPQWGAIEDIFNRANSFGKRALRIGGGTIEDDERSIIVPLAAEQGTGTRLWPKCPHCGRHQLFSWENVRYDNTDEESARATARIVCAHCGSMIDEAGRQIAIRHGKFPHRGQTVDESGDIVGPAPRTTALGLVWSALDATLADLREICADHFIARRQLEARSDHGLMRKFFRYRLCQVYTGDKSSDDSAPQQISKTYLAARSEGSTYAVAERSKEKDGDGYWVADCPAEVQALSIAVDVQRGGTSAPGRLYFLVTGFDDSFRTWDLSWGSLILSPIGAEPTTGQLHAGLDRMAVLMKSLADRFSRPIVRRGVDVGDRQDEIRQWLIRNRDWLAVKGENHGMKATDRWDIAGWVYRRAQTPGGWFLHFIDVNHVRRQAQMQFLVPTGKPGAAHIPRGLNRQDSLIRHYCATAEIPDGRGGTRWSEREIDRKHHPDWERRHDLLDCRTYALALAYQWLREADKKRGQEEYLKTLQSQPQSTSSLLDGL